MRWGGAHSVCLIRRRRALIKKYRFSISFHLFYLSSNRKEKVFRAKVSRRENFIDIRDNIIDRLLFPRLRLYFFTLYIPDKIICTCYLRSIERRGASEQILFQRNIYDRKILRQLRYIILDLNSRKQFSPSTLLPSHLHTLYLIKHSRKFLKLNVISMRSIISDH